jgi:hypothetical protein
MLGVAAVGGLGLWWLLKPKSQEQQEQEAWEKAQKTAAANLTDLVNKAVAMMESPEYQAQYRADLDLVAMQKGEDWMLNASGGEVQAEIDHIWKNRAADWYKSAPLATIDQVTGEAQKIPSGGSAWGDRPPSELVISSVLTRIMAKDPNIRVIPAESTIALKAVGVLPAPTAIAFVSETVPTYWAARGFLVMNIEDIRKRAKEAGHDLMGTPMIHGVAGYGDYVQLPYSGFGAQYGSRGGSGVTGLGF